MSDTSEPPFNDLLARELLATPFDTARAAEDFDGQLKAYAAVRPGLLEDLRFFWVVHNETAFITSSGVRGVADVSLPDGRPALTQEGGLPTLIQVWRRD